MRAALYARVSTMDQTAENQLLELRRYCAARGWPITEYVDTGVSGAKDKRPALDELVRNAKRRRFDVLVCWRLDRLGRNLKHLITLLDDLHNDRRRLNDGAKVPGLDPRYERTLFGQGAEVAFHAFRVNQG